MICDVHAHYIPKNYSDLMGDRFPPRVGVPMKAGIAKHPVSDSAGDISGRLELMDAAGVEKQVLSPHRPPYLPDEVECVRAVSMLNDGYAAGHLVTGSDYPVLQDYEAYKETFAYIERLGLPQADTDKILHHNAQVLFGFRH
jgi:hypothetical protein